MDMYEGDILMWLVALGEAHGGVWSWEEMKFDPPEMDGDA